MAQLEFKDFSGGITDKDLPGSPSRFSRADNLLISVDRKLYQRPAFDIMAAAQMPAAERVARLLGYDSDSQLVGIQNKKLVNIQAGAWTEILGPTGNHAFNSNSAASLIEVVEWNHHAFFASDSGDPVIKMYVDAGTMKMRAAGLPKPLTPAVYTTDAAKLAAAIALAVDIKTQFHAHVNDFGASPAAHLNKDTVADTALDALVTPVTLVDLVAYTKVLRSSYNTHVNDAKTVDFLQAYHNKLSSEYIIPGATLTYVINPILNIKTDDKLVTDANLNTIEEVVGILNDLRNKYNWHARAPLTHNNAIAGGASWGDHFVTVAAVDLDNVFPLVAPNYSTLLRYVNYIKSEYNNHLLDAGTNYDPGIFFGHRTTDTRNKIEMADATDLHEAVAMLGLLEFFYSQHFEDANIKFPGGGQWAATEDYPTFVGTVTSGSPIITAVTPDPTLAAMGITGKRIAKTGTSPPGWFSTNPSFALTDTVSSISTTTITMSANALTNGDRIFSFANGTMHFDIDRNVNARTSSAYAAKLFQQDLDLTLQDLESITAYAVACVNKIKAHMISGAEVENIDEILLNNTIFTPVKNFTYYDQPDTYTGNHYTPHRITTNAYWPTSISLINEIDMGQGFFEAGLAVASYNYKLVYRSEYTASSKAFIDLSTPSNIFTILTVESPQTLVKGDTNARDPLALSGIPILVNAANQNYPTADLNVDIYRTQNNGTVYYKAGSVINGTTTFSDDVMDALLVDNEELYTNGGVVENDLPPIAAHIHILDGNMFYAVGNTVYVSVNSDPDSVPATFSEEFDEDVVGVSSTRSTVVAFTRTTVSRLVGGFDELGQGFLRHEVIFDKTGCISAQSIVKADNGVFFAGNDGFYYTDGFQCYRVADVQDSFKANLSTLAKRNRVQGTYVSAEKRIYWTVQVDGNLSAPDTMWVLDLQFGIRIDATPFTTFSGGFDGFTGFRPTAVAGFLGNLYYGDADGYVFAANPSANMDAKKDTGVSPASWLKRTTLWDYETCHGDYGTSDYRKYFTRITSQFKQETNLSAQIISDADKGRIIDNLPIIRSRKLLDWGDPKIDWTASVFTAKDGSVIDEFRRFKANGSLRSNYRAIRMRNAFCVVTASDQMGNVNVASLGSGNFSVTLINAATRKWPLYSVDYYVQIAEVNYLVYERTSDAVVKIHDSGATLVAASNLQFELWGYPKNEKVSFVGFTVDFQILGQEQKSYKGSTSSDGGENA